MYQEHPHVPGAVDKDWAWPNRDTPTQKIQRFNYPEGKPSEPSPTRTPKTIRKKQLQYIIRGLISQPVIPGMVNSYFKIKSNLEHSSIFSTNILQVLNNPPGSKDPSVNQSDRNQSPGFTEVTFRLEWRGGQKKAARSNQTAIPAGLPRPRMQSL